MHQGALLPSLCTSLAVSYFLVIDGFLYASLSSKSWLLWMKLLNIKNFIKAKMALYLIFFKPQSEPKILKPSTRKQTVTIKKITFQQSI
jgi:hypothetical protein